MFDLNFDTSKIHFIFALNENLCDLNFFFTYATLCSFETSLSSPFFSCQFCPRVSLFSNIQSRYLRVSLDLITIYERDSADLRPHKLSSHWTTPTTMTMSRYRFSSSALFGIPKQAGAFEVFLFWLPWSRSSVPVLSKSSPCNRGRPLIIGASGVYRWLTR